jgi:hypothetical protein
MAQFLAVLYGDPTRFQQKSPSELQILYGKYMGWGDKAKQKGFLLGANKLVDDAGKVLRRKPVATDGPYSETKEVLGGYYLIEAANYDEAVQRFLDHPHLENDGTIEVRQVELLPAERRQFPATSNQ